MADMKNRPLLSVDTAKQNFYDFILNLQVVGYEKTMGGPNTPIVKPVLVHGNYQDIYNKLINAQLVIGAQISLLTPNESIGQIEPTENLTNLCNVYILNNVNIDTGLPETVAGMPLIAIQTGDSGVALDCLNRVYDGDDTIPYDT